MFEKQKLLVQYHGLLLMWQYSGALLCKRTLAGEGLPGSSHPGHSEKSLKVSFYF